MRIVIIEPNAHLAGHYTQELHSFCSELARCVESVVLLTPHGFKDPWEPIDKCRVIALSPENKPEMKPPGNALMIGYGNLWNFFRTVRSALPALKPDIIHVWGYFSVFPMWWFLKGLRSKQKLAITVKAVERMRSPVFGIPLLGSLQARAANQLLARLASRYVVHTEELRRQVIATGISSQRVCLIPTGIELSERGVSRESACAKLGIPQNSRIVLLFGVWRREKGIMETIDLIPSVPRDYRFVIAGEDWTDGEIERRIGSLGVQDRVLLHPTYIPEIAVEEYFRAADVALIAHRPEFAGESGVLLKAMQFGTPVLACEGSHAAALVRERGIGAQFPFGDVQAFLESLHELVDSEKQTRDRVRRNIEAFRRERAWSSLVSKYLELYRSMQMSGSR